MWLQGSENPCPCVPEVAEPSTRSLRCNLPPPWPVDEVPASVARLRSWCFSLQRGDRVRTSNHNYLAGKTEMSPGLPGQGVALGFSVHKASARAPLFRPQPCSSVAHQSNMERPGALPAQTFKAVLTIQLSLTLKLQSPCLGLPSARSTGMSAMPGQKASGKPSQAVSLWPCRAYGNEPNGV